MRITKKYLILQKELHARPEGYGGKGLKWLSSVMYFAGQLGAKTILDYGCGQGSLIAEYKKRSSCDPFILTFQGYDPAHESYDNPPRVGFDLVICTDVLEHVESECLTDVLTHINALALRGVFFVISMKKSNKVMADGRNAHILIEPLEWWQEKLSRYWDLGNQFVYSKKEKEVIILCVN